MEIVPEPDWEILSDRLLERKGLSVIIGSTDSGKSTLVRYFIRRFISGSVEVVSLILMSASLHWAFREQ